MKMTENEQKLVDDYIENHSTPEICEYCVNSDECPKNVVCYGGEPIFPICAEYATETDKWFDSESYLEDIASGLYD